MPEDGRPSSLAERATAVLLCGGVVFVKECDLQLRVPQYLGYDVGLAYPYVTKGITLAVMLCKYNGTGIGVFGVLVDDIIPSFEGRIVVRLNVPVYQEGIVLRHATPENGWLVMLEEEFAVA